MDVSKPAAARVKAVNILKPDVAVRRDSSGNIYLASSPPLGPYPERITQRLEHWAQAAPDRVFLAERDASGACDALRRACSIASCRLIDRC